MNDEIKKDYNPTLVGLYETKIGHWSLPIDSKGYDAFMKNIENGCRVVVKMNRNRKHDKSPHAFLEVIPAAKVAEMDAARAASRSLPSDEI